MPNVERCPIDGYARIRGVCPICEGKQAGDRTPMLAPLPLARDDAKVLALTKKKRRRSA